MNNVYKIRRKSDGKFSEGGQWPGFAKNGKIWKTMAHIKAHLALVKSYRQSPYHDCEIVKYEYEYVEVGTSVDELIGFGA